MEVLALGPLEVRLQGSLHPIGGAHQRALLLRLLLARGRMVPVAALCEELAGRRVARDPLHALQARVSRLRAAVPGLVIEQIGSGYQLDQNGIETDMQRFERLREAGERLLEDGLLRQAGDQLRAALSTWRGPAFADATRLPALEAEAMRLDKLWTAALADRIDIDLALGRAADVIPELAAMVEEYPLLERFWGQLMAALYREGRVQEALAVYARARELFSERFGVEPNAELGRLHLHILHNEPSALLLRLKPVAGLPSQLTVGGQPEVGHATAVTSNRVDTLAELLRQRQALLLTGPAGIGKTHLLRSLRARFEARNCLVPLLSASALSQHIPLGVFAGVAGSPAEGWATAPEVIESFSRHRSTTVLLVDDVDLLDDASLFVIRQLVKTARVRVLLAARTLTGVPAGIRALYDSGELGVVSVEPFSGDEVCALSGTILGGPLAPDTRVRVIDVAAGNPLRVREIVTESKSAGRLVETEHGWQLRGDLLPSPRLVQLSGERFDELDPKCLEAAMLVAVAGEIPATALEPHQLRGLARTHILAPARNGWVRLSDPLDREVLRARCSDLLWNLLAREAVEILSGEVAGGRAQARHRASLLALVLDDLEDAPGRITAHRVDSGGPRSSTWLRKGPR